MEKMETENKRLHEKLSELDFYKSRVDELRAENDILVETKQLVEMQLESWKTR